MLWPDIIREFKKVPNNSCEADFRGPYNKLLYTLFPSNTDFIVVPNFMPDLRGSADHLVTLEVFLEDKPVFVLGLKGPNDLQYRSSRRTADEQVRTRIDMLQDNCPLPVLHAVCAIGTKLCFYRKPRDQLEVEPHWIPGDLMLVLDTMPRDHWNYDILEDKGVQRFQDVVDEIKQACAAL